MKDNKKKTWLIFGIVVVCILFFKVVAGQIAGAAGDGDANPVPAFIIVTLYFSRMLVSIILFVALIMLIPKLKALRKEKQQEYDEKVVRKAVAEIIPQAEFSRNESIKASALYECGIIPGYDADRNDGMIRYRRDGREYAFSNIHLLERKEDSDGDHYYQTIYQGQAFRAHYHTGLSGSVRIFTTRRAFLTGRESRGGYRDGRKGAKKIETESILFNDNFDVYATNEESAFFVLNPVVMEQFLEMKKTYGQFGVYLNGDDMLIALKTDCILFSKKMYNSSREEISLERSKEEARRLLKMTSLLEDAINGSIRNNFTNPGTEKVQMKVKIERPKEEAPVNLKNSEVLGYLAKAAKDYVDDVIDHL